MRSNLLIAAAAASLLAFAPQPAGARPVTLGYVPAFKGLEAAVARADFASYSHIAIAFANPDASGRLVAGDKMACMLSAPGRQASTEELRSAVAAAHAGGSKVLLSLGGGTLPPCSGDWAQLLRPETRDSVVDALIALADDVGLDGIDVDLEGEVMTAIDRAGGYTPFVEALSAKLKARGKLLTCATASYEGGMVPQASVAYFDYVGVMSYDAIGPSWGEAGSEHSPYDQAERDLRLWLKRGVPRERLLLGLPFYGYGFGGTYKPNYAARDVAAEFGKRALKSDVVGRRCPGCAYITYNGIETLKRKARLASEQAGGIMVWEISQDTDRHRLIRTLVKTLKSGRRR